MDRTVSCALEARIGTRTAMELQVAVADPYRGGDELLEVTLDGAAVELTEVATPAGGRMHLADVEPGILRVRYRATVGEVTGTPEVTPLDASTYLRPSRYAESDRLFAVAGAEFGRITDPGELVKLVGSWVGTQLSYLPGSSRGTDGAVDTHLARAGVCRDYAHLTAALLRARDVPARLVSVYAPGLSPMDFHAVVEALVDGRWRTVDPTLLAARRALVRIATGRDAADTAFLSTYGGEVSFDRLDVSAVTSGSLPRDDLDDVVVLP